MNQNNESERIILTRDRANQVLNRVKNENKQLNDKNIKEYLTREEIAYIDNLWYLISDECSWIELFIKMCGFPCKDCGIDTVKIHEYYMIHDNLWNLYCGTKPYKGLSGFLCVACLEQRIGRQLTKEDFTDAPVNDPSLSFNKMSDRLRSRLA